MVLAEGEVMKSRDQGYREAQREAREACDGLSAEDAKHQLEMWKTDREVNGLTPQNQAYCVALRKCIRKGAA